MQHSLGIPDSIPQACPVPLFESFRRNLQNIQKTENLLACAWEVSKISFDDINDSMLSQRVDALVEQIRERCSQHDPRALIAHLHEVMFEREGFCGCDDKHYYFPINSYLNYVLVQKRGLPILLALIYKAVAEKLGLQVEGIHTPGRFLIRIHDGLGWMVVDPFMKGRLLTPAEVTTLVAEITATDAQYRHDNLPIASHAQWIERILTNLARSFDTIGCLEDRDAMIELIYLVQQS